MKYRIVPVEPTDAMIRECQGDGPEHPIIKYLTTAERSGPLFPLAMYRANLAAAPSAADDAELVERVARAMREASQFLPVYGGEPATAERFRNICRAALKAMEG